MNELSGQAGDELAEMLDVSLRTVEAGQRFTRAWLHRRLEGRGE